MHPHITQLYALAQKPHRLIIGLMSGTSLDGLDVALCRISGSGTETNVELLKFATVDYDNTYKSNVKSIFSKREVDLEKVCLVNAWIGNLHAEMIRDCLKKWSVLPAEVDLVASHGQTIYHAPQVIHQRPEFGDATLQIGDGDHIACGTGIITLSDFRQKHIAAGGEGAPLAVYGDYLIFSSREENRVMLNMGGIANFTYLPQSLDATAVFSTDVGPGNTIMDAYVQAHFPGQHYDEEAALAKAGQVNTALLQTLKANGFFQQSIPKTTGPELFNLLYLQEAQAASGTQALSHEDTMATLNQFSADEIVSALDRYVDTNYTIYASGGGIHNPLLMSNIQQQIPKISIKFTDSLAIQADAKEAVLFAILANECVAGGQVSFGNQRQGIPSVTMGKLSFPD